MTTIIEYRPMQLYHIHFYQKIACKKVACKCSLIMILKVVGCKDWVQDNNLPLWGPGSKAPSCCAIPAVFQKKVAILMPFG